MCGEEKSERKWERKHPLSDGCLGKHMVDQVSGRLDHAPCATTGAEAPALAAEGHQVFMKAAVALDAEETVFEQPTPQIVLELLADKSRQVTANTFDLPHEVRIMFRNDGLERGLFRSMPMIGGRDGNRGRSGHWP